MADDNTYIREILRISEEIDDTVYRIVDEIASGKLTPAEVKEIAIRLGAINRNRERKTFLGQTKEAFAPHKAKIILALVGATLTIGSAILYNITTTVTKKLGVPIEQLNNSQPSEVR